MGPQRTRRPSLLVATLTVVAALLVVACVRGDDATDGPVGTGATDPSPVDPTPTGPTAAELAWDTATPEQVGLDPTALDRLVADAAAAGSSCLAVARHGRLVGDWTFAPYDAGARRPIWSITKSITALLVGLAVDDGLLALDQPVAELLPEWRGTPAETVTVRNLLANDSGRAVDPVDDVGRMFAVADQTTDSVGLPQVAAPGTVWAYNNPAVQVLEAVLRATVGDDVVGYAEHRLFAPLGMDATELGLDASGRPLLYAWATSTCRDLARLGVLVAEGGRFAGREVVSPAFLREATTPAGSLNAAQGLLWWLNRDGNVAGTTDVVTGGPGGPSAVGPAARMVEGAPDSLVWAIGFGSQIVQVDPATDTVLVRLSDDDGPDPAFPFGAAEAARLVTEVVVGP
jgi:CubicO group peptidase (beta-lactamase class C family)